MQLIILRMVHIMGTDIAEPITQQTTRHDNVSRSKYVVSQSTFDTNVLSDHEHMMQQHSEHTSEEESHDHDADDVLPDTMVG